MASMYDTIMDLPLFKGIGEEQLSQMLEKTKIEFLKFEDGDILALPHQQVKSIDFILSGKARNSYTMENFPIEIREILSHGNMIAPIRLFGLDTVYASKCEAIGNVSVLRVEKSQYMKILMTDKIYILNFVNYLSAAAQKCQKLMLAHPLPSIERTLSTLAYSVGSRQAEKIMIAGSDEALAAYCGVPLNDFVLWKASALENNKISLDREGICL